MGRTPKQNLPKDLSNVLQSVGIHIHYFRIKKNLTQAELSEKAMVSITTLNEIESRRCRDIRLSTIVSFARALGVSVSDLLNGPQGPISKSEKQNLLRASEDFLKILKQYIPTE